MESSQRSIAKTVSWRFFASIITAVIAWAVTGETKFAATIGAFDALLKIGAYYFHERAWNQLHFGRLKPKHNTSNSIRLNR